MRSVTRRAVALLLAALSLAGGGCQRTQEGSFDVAVIGDQPRLVDPAATDPSLAEGVLLANAAQGLVRFDARGQIEPGLAERWNVSDDGLSYIFRLAGAEWQGGGKVTAQQVARLLRRQLTSSSKNPLKDTLGVVEDVVAMTDRVLEIRLRAPRSSLLQVLAQPEFALVRNGHGSGPFTPGEGTREGGGLLLTRSVIGLDEEEIRREEVVLRGDSAATAVNRFIDGSTDLVLGGTFADLPLVRKTGLPRRSLQFDPVAGLFGLAPARSGTILDDPDVRRLLAQAIDRDALLAELDVPGLLPRATVLEVGLDGLADPVAPQWMGTPIGDRRPQLILFANRQFGADVRPTLRLWLPDGPGADLLLRRLNADWGLLGIQVERAASARAADLVLIDDVAPSTSPAWFLRRFRCGVAPVCDAEVDELLGGARETLIPAQRNALLAQAAQRIDELRLFLPIAAPVRWSLVGSRVNGFAGNRFGVHTLTALGERPGRQGDE
ncbi:MAG TPA: ABC transporter substrate-binding protein [Sphingomicrobium sp.]